MFLKVLHEKSAQTDHSKEILVLISNRIKHLNTVLKNSTLKNNNNYNNNNEDGNTNHDYNDEDNDSLQLFRCASISSSDDCHSLTD